MTLRPAPLLVSLVLLSTAVACNSRSKSSAGSGGSSGAAGSAGSGGAAGSAGTPGDAGTDSGAGGCSGASHDTGQQVTVAGDPGGATLGFGDPSLLYPAGASAGYLTYTAVAQAFAETRIATSSDHGASFSYLGRVNQVTPITVTTSDTSVCGATSCGGNWVHETSSIVDDATDPDASRRYKVFAHSYFIPTGGKGRYEIGSIDLWTAPSITAGTTWKETRLLGWSSSSPRSTTGVATVVTTDPALKPLLGSYVALSEPGAMVRGSNIDLVLGCARVVSASDIPIDMVMIRSTDHGATWKSIGKLLDAAALGGSGSLGAHVNGGDLFQAGGRYYLFATTNGTVADFGAPDGYRGCNLIPFFDIDAGTLEQCGGAPHVIQGFTDPAGHFNGACTYAEGASSAGVMGLTAAISRTPVFQIYSSGVGVP